MSTQKLCFVAKIALMWFILIVKFVFNDISTLVGHLCCLPKNERKGIEELEARELLKVRKIE